MKRQISVETVEQASLWAARILADDVTDHDRQLLFRWRQENPENEEAWQRVEQLQNRFRQLPDKKLGQNILSTRTTLTRRQALILTGLALGAGGFYQRYQWDIKLSGVEYVTVAGEIKSVILKDGTHLTLNTDTRIFVDINNTTRELCLVSGEVMVTTGDKYTSPVQLNSQQGQVIPIGTRFSVRQNESQTQVKVFDGRVQIMPEGSSTMETVSAGENVSFTTSRVSEKGKNSDTDDVWLRQLLVANRMPLPVFVKELSRYRTGVLRSGPGLGDLQVTGIFDLKNTDQTLQHLSEILPVEIRTLTRYLVLISRR